MSLDFIALAQSNLERAQRVLEDTRILDLWTAAGFRAELVGSLGL
ncbi:hypothetical protein [Maridesulfovibrio sp.]